MTNITDAPESGKYPRVIIWFEDGELWRNANGDRSDRFWTDRAIAERLMQSRRDGFTWEDITVAPDHQGAQEIEDALKQYDEYQGSVVYV